MTDLAIFVQCLPPQSVQEVLQPVAPPAVDDGRAPKREVGDPMSDTEPLWVRPYARGLCCLKLVGAELNQKSTEALLKFIKCQECLVAIDLSWLKVIGETASPSFAESLL